MLSFKPRPTFDASPPDVCKKGEPDSFAYFENAFIDNYRAFLCGWFQFVPVIRVKTTLS